MAQEIWFKNDIGNVLLGINQASQAAGGSDEFRAGFRAALFAAAISFGLAEAVGTDMDIYPRRVVGTAIIRDVRP